MCEFHIGALVLHSPSHGFPASTYQLNYLSGPLNFKLPHVTQMSRLGLSVHPNYIFILPEPSGGGACWDTALRRQRQTNSCEFETILDYRANKHRLKTTKPTNKKILKAVYKYEGAYV